MHGLESIDITAFRFCNQGLSNPVFDRLMPWLSGNALFVPALIAVAIALLWKGGTRGRLCVAMLAVILPLGDSWICNTLKRAVHRPRPFLTLSDARVLGGRGSSGSMPSSHAANWFAATMIVLTYYRRSWRFMLPLASGVGFSRIYNGMHYPSDVLAGATLGVAYAAGSLWLLDSAWRSVGPRWFPLWWARLPSLRNAEAQGQSAPAKGQSPESNVQSPTSEVGSPKSGGGRAASGTEGAEAAFRISRFALEAHWLRLGYVLIAGVLVAQWIYLACGQMELSEDEAYQWLWSKHPALSYYSKPPLIAYTQWAATRLWGDTQFGIRFFSPLIGAVLGFLLLRFLARETNARAGFWAVFISLATPLLAVGATLMTIDSLSVLFWTAAMISGWHAVRTERLRAWLWTGLWLALGFLSKYTELIQLLGWVVFFACARPARRQLRRPGPWLALLLNLLGTVPVVIWNARHGWITLRHLENRGGLDRAWQFTFRHFWDFAGAEFGLLNPVFLGAMIWAAIAVTRRLRARELPLYLWCMGVPLFAGYTLYTFRALVQPNWIAPGVLPLLCLMIVYWEERWRAGCRGVKPWLIAGVSLGLVAAILLHDTDLIGKITGRPLTAKQDPLARVRAWRKTARAVARARLELLAEGKPVFIIGDHYGITAILSFYLPEAKAGVPDHPLVYYQSSPAPDNQFYFWPGYDGRKGENAIYVQQVHQPQPPPERLRREFASVTDLGMRDIEYRGRVYRSVQLFACRDLRSSP
ncbi:MAG: glycosyltransferase family 39 protein [Verrucomicrobia bacterium]|nr:glycosyltransferase family 39 protein [Verrucomicrobiota bacterium]